MGRVLRRRVLTGGKSYPAGTKETAALKKAISNPAAWEDDGEREPAPARRSRSSSSSASGGSGSAEGPGNEEPPRGGEGATEEAWREYAAKLELEVPEGAGRDDIIALVDARP